MYLSLDPRLLALKLILVVPSLHHPLQTFHNRPPSPPQFRDLNLPSITSRRPGELDAPTSLLGVIPDAAAMGYEVPFRIEQSGLGRRLPARREALNVLPGRHGQGRN